MKSILNESVDSFGLPLDEAEKAEKITRDTFLYMEPKGSGDDFAQCKTCTMWTGTGCTIHGPDLDVAAEDTCLLYVEGEPQLNLAGQEKKLVDPKTSGFAKTHKSRCENCRSFESGTCLFFKANNEASPDLYSLDEKVNPKGCCNAQVNPS